jgi:hypothetical protein
MRRFIGCVCAVIGSVIAAKARLDGASALFLRLNRSWIPDASGAEYLMISSS